MIVALDVYYDEAGANVGGVAFDRWTADVPVCDWTTRVSEVEDYEPGSFYLRELPCLLVALAEAPAEASQLMTVVIDGYVWLDAAGREGLGAHLFRALDETVAIVGVAKNAFAGNDAAVAVERGASRRPLWVSAAGVDPDWAADRVREMHGDYRLPTVLRLADQLSRRC